MLAKFCIMNEKAGENMSYNPEKELKKGAKVKAISFDEGIKVEVIHSLASVGDTPAELEFYGEACGGFDGSIDGTVSVWLSTFRFMRPNGNIDHVAGWNITLPLQKKQTASQVAASFASFINLDKSRPYFAQAAHNKLYIYYREKRQ